MRYVRVLCLAIALMFAVTGVARAQSSGEIIGVVTDATGSVLPGVRVRTAGTGLQQPLVTETTSDGTYRFPNVPTGTYTIEVEQAGFKHYSRDRVLITSGFTAKVDVKLEVGSIEQRVEVVDAPPLVDTRRTTTGATTSEVILNAIPTARDIWQVINLTPAVVLGGVEGDNTLNVGGSAAGQNLPVLAYAASPFGPGTGGGASPNNILATWKLDGGNITNMVVPVAPTYFNFDSFQEVQVISGGGDASIQSAGMSINIVTKSGSDTLRGGAGLTFENAFMQAQNVTAALFNSSVGATTGLSGSPIHRIDTADGNVGGPIRKGRLWYWGSASTQDINLSIGNFFDSSKPGCNPPPTTFGQLGQVQSCLKNQRTTITNLNGKLNFQPDATNRFQFLVQTAHQVMNNSGARSLLTPEATPTEYTSGGAGTFQNPLVQLTHTWLPTSRVVVVNQLTYLRGGLVSDFGDYQRCGSSTYARDVAQRDSTDPTCQWNIQTLINNTTGVTSRSPEFGVFDAEDRSLELKADGTYATGHVLGGEHVFKFGLGWRTAPSLTYSHAGGGAQAVVQCVNNTSCGDGVSFVPPESPTGGLVPLQAALVRDGLLDVNWHSYFGYFQDSFTTRRLTVTGGFRDDWQTSIALPGCVSANPIVPTLLPQQCQGRIDPRQPFNNIAPRVSVTDDVLGDGKTALHASFAMYYASVSRLSGALGSLGRVELDYGNNQASGACSAVTGASCWVDANRDGVIQAFELIGQPSGPANFVNGALSVVPPTIDPNLKLGRTREGIGGIDHELSANLHVTFDYIYRVYDRGLAMYIAAPSGSPADSVAQIVAAAAKWQPHAFTDPNTGISTTYYTLCSGCAKLTGAKFTTTSLQYTIYRGATVAVVKRLANGWQASLSYTRNDPRVFLPVGSFSTTGSTPGDPTGIEFLNGSSNGTIGYTLKAYGSVVLPWGLLAGMNLNVQGGAERDEVITGPGTVPSGTGAISYPTLLFEDRGASHFPPTRILDLTMGKAFAVRRTQLRLSVNCFNVFNVNTPLLYSSDNASHNGVNGSIPSFTSVASIVPPRVFRLDMRVTF